MFTTLESFADGPTCRFNTCVMCGAILQHQKRGRHRIRCSGCDRKYRKQDKHQLYLNQKYLGMTDKEIEQQELKVQIIKDKNAVLRHNRYVTERDGCKLFRKLK